MRFSLQNLRPLASLFSEDLAIDLGTVNTRVYARGRGIVVNEPSAVALDDSTGEVQAVGKEAKEMLGRTPSKIRVVKPFEYSRPEIAAYSLNTRGITTLRAFSIFHSSWTLVLIRSSFM